MNDINDLAVVMVTEQNFLDGVFRGTPTQNRNWIQIPKKYSAIIPVF